MFKGKENFHFMRPLVKTLIFSLLVPGMVTILIPYHFFSFIEEPPWGFQYIGFFLMALGTVLYLWCALLFVFIGRGTPDPLDPPEIFVAQGPYKKVRNPIYLGVLFILLGEVISFGSWQLRCYMFLVALMFHCFIIFYEEPSLKKKFGSVYEEYCRTVPRWIPRFKDFRVTFRKNIVFYAMCKFFRWRSSH